ncbi:hypothetical protein [Pseudenterobacter timonensis]|uniref:DNA polymerase V n=1 Tax=Pseudenterobacter timonensis TaxID=1755099 RepID=A0ABV4A2B2_9ENTR
MGFPSPATDYVERSLMPTDACGVGAQTRILETDTGYAVIEPAASECASDVLLILSDGRTQFAKLVGGALITDDGEAIEGEALADVEVLGRVTYFINRIREDDDCPVM